MIDTGIDLRKALKQYFGFNEFKGDQENIIRNILSGRNTLVIMPTGGGKSMCYQLPAFLSEGTAIVISPLIALMKNQVDLVRAFGGENGVAHFLNSSLSKKQTLQVKKDVLNGTTKMLYLAPESLTKPDNIAFLTDVRIPFLAVDEAHCISEWGHDFRPEYRRIREIVEEISQSPIIALTASATPKVQDDIKKNLKMPDADVFRSSFNRPNLYYEVRPKPSKDDAVKQIISYIRARKGESGIIYCLSRKSVEELAEVLQVNDVKATPYHAGMDANTRSKHQDAFLMEDTEVIVATIAFGMGIDKPDVRFVIHFDVPKSIESYYQETGRAGRDGLDSDCLLFYNPKDLQKLHKFLKDKPVSEREVGTQLLNEMAAFCEYSGPRRKMLLGYFGEHYEVPEGHNMCDNSRYPRKVYEVEGDAVLALNTIRELNGRYLIEHIADVITGRKTQRINDYQHDELQHFGQGAEKDLNYWKSIMRQAWLDGLVKKDIESYGTLLLTEKGQEYISAPYPLKVAEDRDYSQLKSEEDDVAARRGGGVDQTLLKQLSELRHREARRLQLQPVLIFMEPTLQEMAIRYPLTYQELAKLNGVSSHKAQRYGKPFLELIQQYVDANEIERPDDIVMRSVVKKSANKVFIISKIDQKMPLEEIASARQMSMNELIQELEHIVYSGTRIDINYYIDSLMDEDSQEELFDFFRDADSIDLEPALAEYGEVYEEHEIQLLRVKFISDMAN